MNVSSGVWEASHSFGGSGPEGMAFVTQHAVSDTQKFRGLRHHAVIITYAPVRDKLSISGISDLRYDGVDNGKRRR